MSTASFYVISHERSGTHFAINSLLKNTSGIRAQANVGEWFGPYGDPARRFDHIDQACRGIAPTGTLVKSHCDADLFAARYPTRPVLWVVRDPRDTLVSWFHYLNREEYYANNPQVARFENRTFGEFLRRPVTPFLRHSYSLHGEFGNVAERWAAHTRGWNELASEVCVLRYEDLLLNFEPTLRRVAGHLGLELRPTLEPVAFGEGLSHLPRKGIVGDWRNEASAEDARWMEDVLRRAGVASFCREPSAPPASGTRGAVAEANTEACPAVPRRLLLLRPDAYGDLILFEPVLRLLRQAWPETEIAVLVRDRYADLIPLLDPAERVRWLMAGCDPYREGPSAAALDALRDTVRAFAPDCVVAACAEQTWLEPAVAALFPDTRQASLGPGMTDPLLREALSAVLPVDWAAIYPEKILPAQDVSAWEKNLRLVEALTLADTPRWWPVAQVPEDARARAGKVVAAAGLRVGDFVACAVAGTVNVSIKVWPAAHYGETLAWLEREKGTRALLVGHESERERLEAVRQAARAAGGDPALWLGRDGEMPVLAGLLEASRGYFGNDTGALHLAAALGRPVCAIFGGGTWPRFVPRARRAVTVVQPLPCFGCGWDCLYADAPCIRTILPDSVRAALAQLLAGDAEEQQVLEATGLDPAARALIDAATPGLRFQRADSLDRLRQVQSLTAELRATDADRTARLEQSRTLSALLHESEADRQARQEQVERLTAQLRESETDRLARLDQAELLTVQLRESETDRGGRLEQVETLSARLQASEAESSARLGQVESLTALLHESETDREARQQQVGQLTALLHTSETDRQARFEQIEKLTGWVHQGEADRRALTEHVAELREAIRQHETPMVLLPAERVPAGGGRG